MKKTHPTLKLAGVAAALLLAAGASHAQWIWLNANGSRVYSDRPPPASVPANKIIKRGNGVQTGSTQRVREEPRPLAPLPTEASSAPKSSELTPEQKKQQEEAEAKAKAEAERQAKARADNCQRAINARASLNSGMRMATTDAQGNRTIMDDATRAAELKRANEIIAQDCGK